MTCAMCGGLHSHRAPRERRTEPTFLLRRPRKCSTCNAIYVPASPWLARLLAAVLGTGCVCYAVLDELVPNMRLLISGTYEFSVIVGLVFGTTVPLFGICMIRAAMQGGRARIIGVAWD